MTPVRPAARPYMPTPSTELLKRAEYLLNNQPDGELRDTSEIVKGLRERQHLSHLPAPVPIVDTYSIDGRPSPHAELPSQPSPIVSATGLLDTPAVLSTPDAGTSADEISQITALFSHVMQRNGHSKNESLTTSFLGKYVNDLVSGGDCDETVMKHIVLNIGRLLNINREAALPSRGETEIVDFLKEISDPELLREIYLGIKTHHFPNSADAVKKYCAIVTILKDQASTTRYVSSQIKQDASSLYKELDTPIKKARYLNGHQRIKATVFFNLTLLVGIPADLKQISFIITLCDLYKDPDVTFTLMLNIVRHFIIQPSLISEEIELFGKAVTRFIPLGQTDKQETIKTAILEKLRRMRQEQSDNPDLTRVLDKVIKSLR